VRNKAFGFQIKGTPGQTIVVEASSDLGSWVSMATNIVVNSLIYFSDPSWTNFPHRYYRARTR